ncbi:MAG: IS21 family transposase [Planctomycetota bacterium]
MANQIKVAIVSSILTLRQGGWSFRRIAQTLGIHRETVSRHVRRHEADSKPATNPPPGTGMGQDSKPANPPPGNYGPQSRCAPFQEVIQAKLKQGLSAQRIYQDLVSEHGFKASYTSVKRFVRRLGGNSPLAFRRMECQPGAEGQVDFGRGAPIEIDGRRRFPHVLRVVLSHSRKGHSTVVWRQTTENFIRALEDAFWALGGVPKTLIIDNLRAAVKRADWYDPELNPKIQDFCRHYSTVILPAKPYMPRHKGKVEAGVKYVRNNALKGRVFGSLTEENLHLDRWERQVADHRIHGTTKKQVKQLFEEAEKPALLPLPTTRFPFFHEGQRSVHRDAHVEVDKAYYSVPPEYLGHRVWVRWDSRLVRIFNHRLEQIALHVKYEKGRFCTDPRHIASEKISGVERGAGFLLRRIWRIGSEAARWAQAMLDERGIEGVRVLQGLLTMTSKYTSRQINEGCELALSHGTWRLKALRSLIKSRARQEEFEFVQSHPLIRPMADYGQWLKVSFRKDNGNGNGEFIALGATGGKSKEKGPEQGRALPAVQPPTTALGSLSSGALSSESANHNLPDDKIPVNVSERIMT